jgi:hypothetical protein
MRTSLDFMTFLQESLLQNQVDTNLLVANPFPFSFLKEEMMMMIPGNSTKNKKKITTKE